LKLEIEINDSDYQEYSRKAIEVGIEPNNAILNVINVALRDKRLKARVVEKRSEVEKLETIVEEVEELPLAELEKKIKKHAISQSAIASYLNSTQSTISRNFKSTRKDTPLALKYQKMGDKLLAFSYIEQQIADIQYYHVVEYNDLKCGIHISEEAQLFLSAVSATVQKNLSRAFNVNKFEQLLCDFIYTDLFKNIEFEELYQDIDIFVDTVEEIVDNYFYKSRL